MALPTRGQADWDDEVANHVAGMEADIATAKSNASTAVSNSTTAINIAQGAASSITGVVNSVNNTLAGYNAENAAFQADVNSRVDGVLDHGDVAGTVNIDPAIGIHELSATGPTTLVLGDPPSKVLSVMVYDGAEDVSVSGLEVAFTNETMCSFLYGRHGWTLVSAGGAPGDPPVVATPTQPGTVTVTPTADGYDISFVASTVAAGYERQIDSGSWVDIGNVTTYSHTGLTSGTSHSGAIRAYNSLGERSTARAWGPASVLTASLHSQILALSPALYTRFSQGSIEDFGTLPGTWAAASGATVPALNGTALSPGATGSAVFTSGNTLKRPAVGAALDNAQKLCIIYLADATGLTNDVGYMLYMDAGPKFGFGVNQTYYEFKTQKHLIVFNLDRDTGGTVTRTQYRDGVTCSITFPPSLGATYDVADLYLNGWPFGGNASGFKLDRIAILAGVNLTQPQAQALAEAAGTYGNGGTA